MKTKTQYLPSGVITVTDTNGVINVYNEDEYEELLKLNRTTDQSEYWAANPINTSN